MPRLEFTSKIPPAIDHRRAVLSLRWLVVILASYLTIFSYIGTRGFSVVFTVALAFAISNIALMLIPRERFIDPKVQSAAAVVDILFVSATLFFLSPPGHYLFAPFILIFILAVLWCDLRLVLLAVMGISLLCGAFSYSRFLRRQLEVSVEQFVTMALFFMVAMFYVFLVERLTQDANLSNAIAEEKHIADLMVDTTRALASSLSTEEVLFSIVSRLRDVLDAEDCSIYRVDPATGAARVMMKASQPKAREVAVKLEDYPELKQAHDSRQFLYMPDARPQGIIAIPMVANDAVLGLIDVRSTRLNPMITEANMRFFHVLASTAANALYNAQLFEEVKERARTDFLTGLPNHRSFQETLAFELGASQRRKGTLSLLMIDLDFLKDVNDRYGHQVGDDVIRIVAQTIQTACREMDFAARYGGEEFVVILPDTPLASAVPAAERIRHAIAAAEFPAVGRVTASIGVSSYPENALTQQHLIRCADEALYVAKKSGRDRVEPVREAVAL